MIIIINVYHSEFAENDFTYVLVRNNGNEDEFLKMKNRNNSLLGIKFLVCYVKNKILFHFSFFIFYFLLSCFMSVV